MPNCCDYPTMEKIVMARHNHHFSSWNQERVHVESEPIENSLYCCAWNSALLQWKHVKDDASAHTLKKNVGWWADGDHGEQLGRLHCMLSYSKRSAHEVPENFGFWPIWCRKRFGKLPFHRLNVWQPFIQNSNIWNWVSSWRMRDASRKGWRQGWRTLEFWRWGSRKSRR